MRRPLRIRWEPDWLCSNSECAAGVAATLKSNANTVMAITPRLATAVANCESRFL
jgi:hypothetical protein